MSKHSNYMTTEELIAAEGQREARLAREETFVMGDATSILEQWDTDPPSYEELLAIVKNMLTKQANAATSDNP
jgi:hypothetical protein